MNNTEYRERIKTAQEGCNEAKKELERLAHEEKAAYRYSRMYIYKMGKIIEAIKGDSNAQ
jgi:hypothetical protein